MKLAETLVSPFIVTTQLPEPLHAPPQPANFEPLAGVALNVTCVPGAKAELQVEPQSIPPGELVTVPLPPPDFATDKMSPVPTSRKTVPYPSP